MQPAKENFKKMNQNDKNIYDRALARTQKETADIFKSVRKKKDYQEKESKTLIREVASSIVPLDNQRKQINTLLKNTTDKKQRLDLLEEYHQVNSKITDYWENKNKKWIQDGKDLEKEKDK